MTWASRNENLVQASRVLHGLASSSRLLPGLASSGTENWHLSDGRGPGDSDALGREGWGAPGEGMVSAGCTALKDFIGVACVRGAEVSQAPSSVLPGPRPALRVYSTLARNSGLQSLWPEWRRLDTETLCRWVDAGFLKIT